MLKYWDSRNARFSILVSLMLVLASCTSKYSKKEIFADLNNQCEKLPVFNDNEWDLVSFIESDSHWEFKNMLDSNQYLIIHKDLTFLQGYYYRKTEDDYLNMRFKDCDTVLYYKIFRTNLESDTIFIKGYYQYLFDNNRLNAGQKRFFKRNLDSLISIEVVI